MKMFSKTSTGVNFLGVPLLCEYIKHSVELSPELKNSIISVGSGGGYLEKIISDDLDISITCVDPDPLSCIADKTIYVKPQYSTVDDIPSEFVGNCILLLNWPTAENANGYDLNAIMKLHPVHVIIIAETGVNRAAGSIGFHEFLKHNNIATFGGYDEQMDKCEEPERLVYKSYTYRSKTMCVSDMNTPGCLNRYSVIHLSNIPLSANFPVDVLPYDHPNNCSDIRTAWEEKYGKTTAMNPVGLYFRSEQALN